MLIYEWLKKALKSNLQQEINRKTPTEIKPDVNEFSGTVPLSALSLHGKETNDCGVVLLNVAAR